jgi:hypothetical protein
MGTRCEKLDSVVQAQHLSLYFYRELSHLGERRSKAPSS